MGGGIEGRPADDLVTRHAIRNEERRLHILFVEDVPINRRIVQRILEKQGHRVTTAKNGRVAIERWEKKPFDLVFMDIQMPEMDGYTATAAIRARERETGRHVPIAAMTAYAMQGDGDKCLAAGMDAYLTKPVNANEILMTIRRLAGRKESVREAAEAAPEAARTAQRPLDGDGSWHSGAVTGRSWRRSWGASSRRSPLTGPRSRLR